MAADFAKLLDLLVEWIYEQAGENPLAASSILPFAHEHEITEQAFDLLRFGESKGLLDGRQSSMGDPYAQLTAQGLSAMEERLRLRSSPAARSAAARKALLVWLWHQRNDGVNFPLVDDILETDEALFEGDRLTLVEMDRAAAYLYSKALIKAGAKVEEREGPVRAEIASDGLDCVEHFDGDISAYERRNSSGNTTFNITENTGNIAANSRDFTMNAATNNGIDPVAVVMLARALRQAAPALELPEADVHEFTQLATRIEAEAANGSPDPDRLRRWGASVIGILNSPVVSGALGSVLAAYAAIVLPGLPPA
jgi:hypothetical protein